MQPEKPRQETAPRPKKKALLSRQARLDADLSTAQTALAELDRQLGDPATYADASGDRISSLNSQRQSLAVKVALLEESWLELEIALEDAV